MKLKKKIILQVGLLLIFVVAIFFSNTYFKEVKSQKKQEENIQAVIEQIFTCPDLEMINAIATLYNANFKDMSEPTPTGTIVTIDTAEVENKLKEKYMAYISAGWYDSFVQHFYNQFNIYSTAIGYESKVERIEFTRSEKIPTNYSFTIYLNYGPSDSEKKDIKVEGSAQISEKDNKVSYLRLFTDRDFIMEFWNASHKS